jgi:hypothetical protein
MNLHWDWIAQTPRRAVAQLQQDFSGSSTGALDNLFGTATQRVHSHG